MSSDAGWMPSRSAHLATGGCRGRSATGRAGLSAVSAAGRHRAAQHATSGLQTLGLTAGYQHSSGLSPDLSDGQRADDAPACCFDTALLDHDIEIAGAPYLLLDIAYDATWLLEFSINAHDSLTARQEFTFTTTLGRDGRRTSTAAWCRMTATRDTSVLTARLEAFEGGRPCSSETGTELSRATMYDRGALGVSVKTCLTGGRELAIGAADVSVAQPDRA